MKIGIDARLYKETGVGRYIRNLIKHLQLLDRDNEYVLFVLKEDEPVIKFENPKWKKVIADMKWHSFEEQIKMPMILNRENCDLVHFPYFNVPLLYGRKFVVTIHDLTILRMPTGRATTHSKPYYEVKRLGFKTALQHGISQSKKIITVSEAVKKEIMDSFNIPLDKILVTYESGEINIDSGYSAKAEFRNDKEGDFLLYVGNAHPHKNLETLIRAYPLINKNFPNLKLFLAGKDDFFYQRLKEEIPAEIKNNVIIKDNVADSELAFLYKNARMLVFPSFSEGFGIPGLEAMKNGCPVVCSDIPVFKEIYGDAVLIFNPKNPEDIATQISRLLTDENLRRELIEKGHRQADKYSWKKMAEETLNIYKSVA